ncbi:hypothetical protein BDD12DRAFT_766386 [Trichophaea hybrida]|nr:hypothetical protein BDD12DRAFT_766386 [Trichophaea hybrida]
MAPSSSPAPATIPKPRPAPTNPETPFNTWLAALNQCLPSVSEESLSSLFLTDSFWRDHLCLSWDYKTAHQLPNIYSLLSSSRIETITRSSSHPILVLPLDFEGQVPAITAFVDVKTTVGHGRGIIRLLEDSDGKWKAYTVFTALMGLDKYPEKLGKTRPVGVTHGADKGRKNWSERRQEEKEFLNTQPTVLIVGAGHSGLVVAARLKMMGIESLVIDRNERVGDNWRKRYHQLVLHDPVQFDHMPYLPFPTCWPTFTPKDKIGDWFEFYASALELNVWTSSQILASSWDEASESWTVTVSRGLATPDRELRPSHIILATGASGIPQMPEISGLDSFKGDVICHSSSFLGAKVDGQGRKAVVVGCCNSAHDIAQDYYEKGYDVTIVQRGSTCVMTSESLLGVMMKGVYDEDGPPVEDADLLFHSFPIALFKRNQVLATNEIARRDKEVLNGLEKVGFTLDKGPDNSGLFMKYLESGGGYYLDIGASNLIATGAIKFQKIGSIIEVLPDGIKFDTGTLPADEIVFATGFGSMVTTARRILGDETLKGVGDVWGFNENAEMKGIWRQAKKGLWFMGGSLALSRWYSRGVAMGIGAAEQGLME